MVKPGCSCDMGHDHERTCPRGRLYDAAPALLEALEGVDEWHDLIKQNYPEMLRAFTKARAAIAQAKGAQ